MSTKNFKTRMQQKTDTSANWALAANSFKPLKGEVCLYSDLGKFKVGDGIHYINELDFYYQDDIDAAENIIEAVKINGTALTITNKAVNIETTTPDSVELVEAASVELSNIATSGDAKDLTQTSGDVLIFNCGTYATNI